MKKAINIWLIVTGVLALVFGILTYINRDSRGEAEYYEGDNTVEICNTIELDLLKTDVRLIPSAEDRIRIKYKSIVPLSVMMGDNRLVIKESDQFLVSFAVADEESFGLELYLPKNIYDNITVYTSSGNVEVGRIDSYGITVMTKSGDIDADETRSLVQLSSGTGDISLHFDSAIDGSSVETRRGNAEILFPRGSSVALAYETETGKFECDLLTGSVEGSYMYSFSGGENLISADVESGTLTVGAYDK